MKISTPAVLSIEVFFLEVPYSKMFCVFHPKMQQRSPLHWCLLSWWPSLYYAARYVVQGTIFWLCVFPQPPPPFLLCLCKSLFINLWCFLWNLSLVGETLLPSSITIFVIWWNLLQQAVPHLSALLAFFAWKVSSTLRGGILLCIYLHIYVRILFWTSPFSDNPFCGRSKPSSITLRVMCWLITLRVTQPKRRPRSHTYGEAFNHSEEVILHSYAISALLLLVYGGYHKPILASLDSLILIIKRCIPFSLLWDLYFPLHQLCSFGNICWWFYFHIPLSYLVAHYTPCYPTHAAKVSHLWRSLQPLLGGMFFYLAFICYFYVKLVNKVFQLALWSL